MAAFSLSKSSFIINFSQEKLRLVLFSWGMGGGGPCIRVFCVCPGSVCDHMCALVAINGRNNYPKGSLVWVSITNFQNGGNLLLIKLAQVGPLPSLSPPRTSL